MQLYSKYSEEKIIIYNILNMARVHRTVLSGAKELQPETNICIVFTLFFNYFQHSFKKT